LVYMSRQLTLSVHCGKMYRYERFHVECHMDPNIGKELTLVKLIKLKRTQSVCTEKERKTKTKREKNREKTMFFFFFLKKKIVEKTLQKSKKIK
jgi:hypothetical protein